MNKSMKVIITILLVTALSVSATACGGSPSSASAATVDSSAVTVSSGSDSAPESADTEKDSGTGAEATAMGAELPSEETLITGEALEKDVTEDLNADLGEVELNGKTYTPKQNVMNILLLGIDSDAERAKKSMGWRSDMIMLCSIDMDTNQITLTSVPRDTRAKVYHLDSNGKIKSEVVEKLNHAYSYGGGPNNYSAENAMRSVEEFLECSGLINVPITSYISIDLDGLPKLATALDGVEVTLDQNVPDVGKKGETVNLMGETVRKYLENRHDMDDGEMTRQQHEQEFIRSMAIKIKDMGAASVAGDLYDTFMKFMRTNLSVDEVLSLASVLDSASIDEMQFNLMEEGAGEIIDGVWYYRASQDEVIHQMLDVMYTEA